MRAQPHKLTDDPLVIAALDLYHELPIGLFSTDEQGIERCTVVETIFLDHGP